MKNKGILVVGMLTKSGAEDTFNVVGRILFCSALVYFLVYLTSPYHSHRLPVQSVRWKDKCERRIIYYAEQSDVIYFKARHYTTIYLFGLRERTKKP
jgi:hypothetical protein